ncbi:CAT1 catalase, partial [Aureobasidium melanogenum]
LTDQSFDRVVPSTKVTDLSIGVLLALVLSEAIVGAVKGKILNTVVALDTSSLLQTAGKVLRDVAEDGNLALDDLLLAAGAHTFSHKARGALKSSSRISDRKGTLTELSRLNGREVRRARALVVEGHASIPLEITNTIWYTGSVNRQLLVVDTDAVTVGVGGFLDVLVQEELSNLAERELTLGPDVGQIENVDLLVLPEVLGLLRGHDPSGGHRESSLDLSINPLALLVDELGGVSVVSVHLTPVLRNTAVTHENHDLVDGLGVLRKVIPEHGRVIGVGQVGGGIALLGCCWRQHPSYPLVGTRLATNSGESNSDGALLAGLENVGHTQVVKRVGGLVVTVGTTTLGVNDTLGNTLAVEVRKKVYQVEVLEEKRTVLSDTLNLVGVRHGDTIAGSVQGVLRGGIAVVVVVAVKVTVLSAVRGQLVLQLWQTP